jgi:hypothetical protein
MKKAIFIFLLPPLMAVSAERFVAPTGSNLNDGSRLAPWSSVSYAATKVVAGDTVRVQPGTYNETVTETTDGTRLSPITYVADGRVVLRRFDITGDYVK